MKHIPARLRGMNWTGTSLGSMINNQNIHRENNRITIGRSAPERMNRLPKISSCSVNFTSQNRNLNTSLIGRTNPEITSIRPKPKLLHLRRLRYCKKNSDIPAATKGRRIQIIGVLTGFPPGWKPLINRIPKMQTLYSK